MCNPLACQLEARHVQSSATCLACQLEGCIDASLQCNCRNGVAEKKAPYLPPHTFSPAPCIPHHFSPAPCMYPTPLFPRPLYSPPPFLCPQGIFCHVWKMDLLCVSHHVGLAGRSSQVKRTKKNFSTQQRQINNFFLCSITYMLIFCITFASLYTKNDKNTVQFY